MKRIVLCLDGTWGKVGKTHTPTNVVRFAQSIRSSADGVDQIIYYNAGVGTDGRLDQLLGGFFGVGLKRNIQRAYLFCALNYRPGDEIYIFGFSRGAYTARAVAGIIDRVGLVHPRFLDRFEEVWQRYRQRQQSSLADPNVKIKCVGVWDTVGSYGIPAGGLGAITSRPGGLRFYNTSLGHKISVALHAVAIDEHGGLFPPTFWTQGIGETLPGHQVCEQVWFAGGHSDVGGGNLDHRLSDIAMVWMMARVSDLTGLRFDLAILKGLVAPDVMPDITAPTAIHRVFPFDRPILGKSALVVGRFKNEDDETRRHINEAIHWSVEKRVAAGRYRPKNLPMPLRTGAVTTPSPTEREIWQALAEPTAEQ
jgi:uncharacterized protein (DUF2235 family)